MGNSFRGPQRGRANPFFVDYIIEKTGKQRFSDKKEVGKMYRLQRRCNRSVFLRTVFLRSCRRAILSLRDFRRHAVALLLGDQPLLEQIAVEIGEPEVFGNVLFPRACARLFLHAGITPYRILPAIGLVIRKAAV